jgi:hypothetical protein
MQNYFYIFVTNFSFLTLGLGWSVQTLSLRLVIVHIVLLRHVPGPCNVDLLGMSDSLPESESESELLYDWPFTANQFVLATSPLRITTSIFSQLYTCGHRPYITSSLTRGWVCRLQLLRALASAVIIRSESHGTHDHIVLSQVRDFPKLEGQVPVFISPRNRADSFPVLQVRVCRMRMFDHQVLRRMLRNTREEVD